MKSASKILLVMLAVLTARILNAQEITFKPVNTDRPLEQEAGYISQNEDVPQRLLKLERMHKEALENRRDGEAGKIAEEINSMIPSDRISATVSGDAEMIFIDKAPEEPEGDWLFTNPAAYQGYLAAAPGYNKSTDMKAGEDGNLYLATIWKSATHPSGLATFKSTNNGLTWNFIYGFYYTSAYVGNISLLVESRNNNIPDSTRLILFYNRSSLASVDNATLWFSSWRANGTGSYSGQIASPSSGNEIGHISSVSDGAFYQNATYIGVVYTETTNDLQSKVNMRYSRSIDWGATWSTVTIQTNLNDFHPSADFKRGSPDSVYIAVERRFGPTSSQIRIIATPFSPSSSYFTYFITNETVFYKNPCLSVQQNSPADSMALTCTKNNELIVFYNMGNNAWLESDNFGGASGQNVSLSSCSSNPNGNEPFAITWVSKDGDSLNSAHGKLSSIHSYVKKAINRNGVFTGSTPVCAVFSKEGRNGSAVAYQGALSETVPHSIHVNQSKFGVLHAKFIPEGLYDPVTNTLRRQDTVTAILHQPVAPYAAYDTAKAVLNQNDFTATFYFTRIVESSLYVEFRHRNSIETWNNGSNFINFNTNDSAGYNFTLSASSAYGYNQVKVRNSPPVYAFYTGDINQDGTVDASDLSMIDNAVTGFLTGYLNEDVSGDNFVDATDYAYADNNAKKFVSVSKPF